MDLLSWRKMLIQINILFMICYKVWFSLTFSSSKVWLGKKIIIFGVDSSSLVYNDNKKKDILVLNKSPIQGLHDTIITAEGEYSITFSRLQIKSCLSRHYIGSNSSTKNINSKARTPKQNHIHVFWKCVKRFYSQ